MSGKRAHLREVNINNCAKILWWHYKIETIIIHIGIGILLFSFQVMAQFVLLLLSLMKFSVFNWSDFVEFDDNNNKNVSSFICRIDCKKNRIRHNIRLNNNDSGSGKRRRRLLAS